MMPLIQGASSLDMNRFSLTYLQGVDLLSRKDRNAGRLLFTWNRGPSKDRSIVKPCLLSLVYPNTSNK